MHAVEGVGSGRRPQDLLAGPQVGSLEGLEEHGRERRGDLVGGQTGAREAAGHLAQRRQKVADGGHNGQGAGGGTGQGR